MNQLAIHPLGPLMKKFAKTPKPPYYAVIFTSMRSEVDDGYADISRRLIKELARQPGFLGYEGARQDIGISVSYWESLEAIQMWKETLCTWKHSNPMTNGILTPESVSAKLNVTIRESGNAYERKQHLDAMRSSERCARYCPHGRPSGTGLLWLHSIPAKSWR